MDRAFYLRYSLEELRNLEKWILEADRLTKDAKSTLEQIRSIRNPRLEG
jgi:hypothetical protein